MCIYIMYIMHICKNTDSCYSIILNEASRGLDCKRYKFWVRLTLGNEIFITFVSSLW